MSEIDKLKERVRVLEQFLLDIAAKSEVDGGPIEFEVTDLPFFNEGRCVFNQEKDKWELVK